MVALKHFFIITLKNINKILVSQIMKLIFFCINYHLPCNMKGFMFMFLLLRNVRKWTNCLHLASVRRVLGAKKFMGKIQTKKKMQMSWAGIHKVLLVFFINWCQCLQNESYCYRAWVLPATQFLFVVHGLNLYTFFFI